MTFANIAFETAEREIIQRLQSDGASKRKAEEDLFNRYAYFIREGTRKFSIPEDDSIDLYSDTILTAIEKITNRSFEGRSSLKTYLFQIFHNKCVDLLRKKTTNKNRVHQTVSINDLLMQLSDSAKPVIQQLTEKADWEAVKRRLNTMGGNCRELLLFFADGYHDKDIAIALQYKNADVVKTTRLRCLDKLRHSYKQEN